MCIHKASHHGSHLHQALSTNFCQEGDANFDGWFGCCWKKNTIFYKRKLGKIVTTIPIIIINVEFIKYKNISFTTWDVGRHYFQNTQALIFVVDNNDRGRVVEARDELHQMLNEDELWDAVLRVFANK
ncbi:hypothetical protein L7F22_035907 [Adiantum nelumboides]|nr:hypothetical protein [Adiantum nelumboides]